MIILRSKLLTLTLASGAMLLPMSAEARYDLDLSRGRFPADVTVENANGTLPDVAGYKHGYTRDGWMVDRLYDYGYVAVSPTWTGGKGECENILTLPPVKIEGDSESLHWTAVSVYRHFPESYRVEAFVDGTSTPVTLFEIEGETGFPSPREVSLGDYAGKQLTVRFVSTGSRGYLLALWNVGLGDVKETEVSPEAENVSPGEDPFRKSYLVDHGTGIWCVNCPAAEVGLDNLKYRLGDALVTLNTHVNDALANQSYWEQLKWYSVPRMMLDRNKATVGEGTTKFGTLGEESANFAIRLTEVRISEARTLKAKASVSVAAPVDNAGGNYRVAYVVTGDFHQPDDIAFAQKNNCNLPAYGPYYYLPSTIPPALMYYEDVTLTSDTAFSGIEGSLPATLAQGEEYEVEWEVDVPELLADPAGARMVAFVLDAATGEVQNVNALRVGEKPSVGVKGIRTENSPAPIYLTAEGIRIDLPCGEAYRVDLYSVSGGLMETFTGMGKGREILTPSVGPGIYIVSLDSETFRHICKIIIR